ncbi:MAG: hypothetical protein Q9224_006745 [Gallowayella concinna]
MDHDSLRKMSALAEHPVFRHKVVSVDVFVSMISEDLIIQEDYEREIRKIRPIPYEGQGHSELGFDRQDLRLLSDEAIGAGYRNYFAALQEQAEARSVAGPILLHALKTFHKLRCVSTRDVHFCLECHEIVQPQPAKVYHLARRVLAPSGCSLVWTLPPYPSEDAKLVWEAVAESQRSIPHLGLGGEYHPINQTVLVLSGPDLTNLSKAFRNTQEFTIALDTREEDHYYMYPDETLPAFGFLDHAPNLRALSIILFNPGICSASFLGRISWPHLVKLRLQGMSSTEHHLRYIIRSVRPTLERLVLRDFSLGQGSWRGAFQEMKGCSLTVLDLDRLCAVIHGLIALTDAHMGLIRDFVCEGKTWSKSLPEPLSRQS